MFVPKGHAPGGCSIIHLSSRKFLKSILRFPLILFLFALWGFLPIMSGLAQDTNESDVTFSVALTGKYPPFSFYHSQTGDLIGFDVDVSREVAKRIGRPVEIITTEWDGILAGLLAGKYDAIIGSMAITPARAEKVNFSKPYYESGAQIFIHKDDVDKYAKIEDLYGKKVGVVVGETFEQYLREKQPLVDIATYDGTVGIFQDMENRRIQGFLTDRLVGLYQIKASGRPFVPAGPMLYRERMGIPVQKGRDELLRKINAALEDMEQDGTLDTIHRHWFGYAPDETALSGNEGVLERDDSAGISNSVAFRMLARGFAVTLLVAFSSLLIGFIIAVPSGLALHSGGAAIRLPIRAIVDFIRGTPVLIQLLFVYFVPGSIHESLNLSPITAAIITLSINAASYMAEIVRSGLMAVDPGQKRAARALGLSKWLTFRRVVWPQAFRVAMPPLMNSTVALLKDTALISIIAVSEVVSVAKSLVSVSYDPGKWYLIVAIMFFVFTFPLMKLAGVIENRIKKKGFDNA